MLRVPVVLIILSCLLLVHMNKFQSSLVAYPVLHSHQTESWQAYIREDSKSPVPVRTYKRQLNSTGIFQGMVKGLQVSPVPSARLWVSMA